MSYYPGNNPPYGGGVPPTAPTAPFVSSVSFAQIFPRLSSFDFDKSLN